MAIIAGCSGYRYYRPAKGWKQRYEQKLQAYADHFPLIEINSTFYHLPRVSTAEKWRRLADEVNKEFIFTVKANQRITHPPSSPTYKKGNLEIPQEKKEQYGYLQPTEEVMEAWEETKEICEALSAKVCLFQTPTSFQPTDKHLTNLKSFFSQISGNITLAFEPRGEAWKPNIMREISETLEITHVVDPFKEEAAGTSDLRYFRLHGLGKRKYKYKFSNKDLRDLYEKCQRIDKGKEIFVLFNNYEMFDDCQRFLRYVRTGELPPVSWGSEAVVEEIDIEYPTTKSEILSKCGNWWVWVTPKKSIRVKQALEPLKEDESIKEEEELLQLITESTDLN